MLAKSVSNATNVPVIKTGMVIGPAPVGIKNPITVEAISIFERSAKYFDSASI